MRKWKRNAVVAVVVLFICVAVYLNWSYNRPEDDYLSFEDEETGKTLGEAVFTGNTQDKEEADALSDEDVLLAEVDPTGGNGEQAADVDDEGVSAAAESGYFAEARLTRQQARDGALSMLKEIGNADVSKEERDKAAANVDAIAQNAVCEARIESLIKAKGFADCVAFISGNSVSIVVPAPSDGLSTADVAKITDIASSESNMPAEKIKIVPLTA